MEGLHPYNNNSPNRAVIIKTKKGLDLPLAGRPEQSIDDAPPVSRVAVLGRDFVGLKPGMLVAAGDQVSAGQPLFFDKRDPAVKFTAPASGTVAAINRGNRRRLLSVIIEVQDNATQVGVGAVGKLREALQETGLWSAFRTRPYGKVPHSDSRPQAIFVTAIDTNPLAPDPNYVIAGNEATFNSGLFALKELTDGPIHLCTASGWQGFAGDERIQHSEFSGPHPAGLPGTHIHFLEPVSALRTVWHIGYQDVIAIGRLVDENILSFERTIALAGPGIASPRLLRTRAGAAVDELSAGELQHAGVAGGEPRLLAGSVLAGRHAHGAEAFLGRYHRQLSAIPEGGERRWFGWLGLRQPGHTYSGLLRRAQPGATKKLSTASSAARTSIPIDAFERVLPLDMLPVPLLRALMIRDTEQAQALGCLELEPEDLALCSYVCPGKTDYGSILRVNLDLIEREG